MGFGRCERRRGEAVQVGAQVVWLKDRDGAVTPPTLRYSAERGSRKLHRRSGTLFTKYFRWQVALAASSRPRDGGCRPNWCPKAASLMASPYAAHICVLVTLVDAMNRLEKSTTSATSSLFVLVLQTTVVYKASTWFPAAFAANRGRFRCKLRFPGALRGLNMIIFVAMFTSLQAERLFRCHSCMDTSSRKSQLLTSSCLLDNTLSLSWGRCGSPHVLGCARGGLEPGLRRERVVHVNERAAAGVVAVLLCMPECDHLDLKSRRPHSTEANSGC